MFKMAARALLSIMMMHTRLIGTTAILHFFVRLCDASDATVISFFRTRTYFQLIFSEVSCKFLRCASLHVNLIIIIEY
jgi:hypothetical protein